MYDEWRGSGIAMSYDQWRALKDSVKTSMHWATPKTSGRMLDLKEAPPSHFKEEPLSLNPSPPKEIDLANDEEVSKTMADQPEEFYNPIPYSQIPFRMATPPFEEWSSNKLEERSSNAKEIEEKQPQVAMRRRQFAVRRQSTIGAMVMAEKWEDSEIRRRFRNYEI